MIICSKHMINSHTSRYLRCHDMWSHIYRLSTGKTSFDWNWIKSLQILSGPEYRNSITKHSLVLVCVYFPPMHKWAICHEDAAVNIPKMSFGTTFHNKAINYHIYRPDRELHNDYSCKITRTHKAWCGLNTMSANYLRISFHSSTTYSVLYILVEANTQWNINQLWFSPLTWLNRWDRKNI